MNCDDMEFPAKAELRRLGIAGRDGVSPADRAEFDRRITEAVLNTPAFIKARVVMVYRHFGGEVNVDAVADAAQARQKTVVYPYCADKTTILALQPHGPDSWIRGSFGIWAPLPEKSEVIDPAAIDAVILPCAAFDDHGNRIGMGAGYYDRFLPKCKNATTILVAYEAQRVTGIVPEPTDIPADFIVTENTYIP